MRSGCIWGISSDLCGLCFDRLPSKARVKPQIHPERIRTQQKLGKSSLLLYSGPFSINLRSRVKLSYKVLWIACQAWVASTQAARNRIKDNMCTGRSCFVIHNGENDTLQVSMSERRYSQKSEEAFYSTHQYLPCPVWLRSAVSRSCL